MDDNKDMVQVIDAANVKQAIKRGGKPMVSFVWTRKRAAAAVLTAQGYFAREVSAAVHISERQMKRWRANVEFRMEVDRLSVMVDVASRAERLRIAARVARQRVHDDGTIETRADLLDWLKFAQSETDGAKLDLTSLLASFTPVTPLVADGGPDGVDEVEGDTGTDAED
jgi:hypothetical protein